MWTSTMGILASAGRHWRGIVALTLTDGGRKYLRAGTEFEDDRLLRQRPLRAWGSTFVWARCQPIR